jgi:hypothetical protein
MQGSWNNDQAYYRCTYPYEYARTNDIDHPRVVYLREAEVLPELDAWLSTSLDTAQLPATIEALAASQDDVIPRELAALKDEISACDHKLAQYRKALDSGADPAVVGQWIAETQARKLAADARLSTATGTRPPGHRGDAGGDRGAWPRARPSRCGSCRMAGSSACRILRAAHADHSQCPGTARRGTRAPVPDVDPLQVQAAQVFAGDLASCGVPSVRAIRARLHVGQPLAQRVQAYRATLAS